MWRSGQTEQDDKDKRSRSLLVMYLTWFPSLQLVFFVISSSAL